MNVYFWAYCPVLLQQLGTPVLCLSYCGFTVSPDTSWGKPSFHPCSFSKSVLAILGPGHIHTNVKIRLSSTIPKPLRIQTGVTITQNTICMTIKSRQSMCIVQCQFQSSGKWGSVTIEPLFQSHDFTLLFLLYQLGSPIQ